VHGTFVFERRLSVRCVVCSKPGAESTTKPSSGNGTATANGSASGKSKKPAETAANKFPAGELSIFFGSQTGTAEGFARTIMEEAKAKGFNAKMCDLEDFDPEVLASTRLAVFLMATYGEGEPTDNAAKFTKWLKSEGVAEGFLSTVKFTVFGLGNRQYEHFNAMGKLTNNTLEKFGAARVFEYGEGDDDNALEEDFEGWKSKLIPALVSQFHPDGASSAGDDSHAEVKRVELQYVAELGSEESVTQRLVSQTTRARLPSDCFEGAKVNTSTKHYFTSSAVTVAVNRELRSSSGRLAGSTKHIELDLMGSSLGAYDTAENLAILPHNLEETVDAVSKSQGFKLDQVFTLVAVAGTEFRAPFPTPCTIGEALTMYYDINGPPRAATVARFIPYITDPKQKEWLETMVSKENRHSFPEFVYSNGISITSLLTNELSSCKMPLSDFLNIVPFLQPRFYTISSSSAVHPHSIHATVSVTRETKASGKVVQGICSTYLAGVTPGSSCRVYLRASSFKLPQDISAPVIMIGPGTGIAPMRAILQERALQRSQSGSDVCGKNTLYFGCRRRDEDFIYEDELREYEQSGVLDVLHLAFSREGAKKVYVQNLMRIPENATAIIQDLEKGGFLYVCGATSMGTDVQAALAEIFTTVKGKSGIFIFLVTCTYCCESLLIGASKEEAASFVKKLQDQGRYVQELWSV
jgi:NADPH-ferrihemoprotein reductase